MRQKQPIGPGARSFLYFYQPGWTAALASAAALWLFGCLNSGSDVLRHQTVEKEQNLPRDDMLRPGWRGGLGEAAGGGPLPLRMLPVGVGLL